MFRRRTDGPVDLARVIFDPGDRVPSEYQKVRVSAFPNHKMWPHNRVRRMHVVTARRSGRLVGFALMFTDSEDRDVDLNDLAVHVDQQRKGTGQALCADAIEWMRELGYDLMTGYPSSDGPRKIFERLGFRLGLPRVIGYGLELRPF